MSEVSPLWTPIGTSGILWITRITTFYTVPVAATRTHTTMQRQPEDQPLETSSLLHRNRDLAVLYDIAGYLNRIVDVHEALQGVLVRVTDLLGLRTGWVWLLDERHHPYLAAALALPPYLADHPERMSGSCVCLDTFLSGDSSGAY